MKIFEFPTNGNRFDRRSDFEVRGPWPTCFRDSVYAHVHELRNDTIAGDKNFKQKRPANETQKENKGLAQNDIRLFWLDANRLHFPRTKFSPFLRELTKKLRSRDSRANIRNGFARNNFLALTVLV